MRYLPVTLVCLSSVAYADIVPMRDTEQVVPDKTFYNNAERNRAHKKESLEVTAHPEAIPEIEREKVRSFYVMPMMGLEFTSATRELYSGTATAPQPVGNVLAYAPAFAIAAGWRLGNLSLGARYQGAVFVDPDYRSLVLNKAYGELGFNARANIMLFSVTVAGGYAFAVTPDTFTNGAGGRFGIAFDFLLNRFFSMGPGFAFDVHAYRPTSDWIVAYGGTTQLRVGFHL